MAHRQARWPECFSPSLFRAATIAPSAVTPDLIEAARKEGKVSYYAAIQLDVAERLGKLFEAKYPGIAVHVERSGAERIFQRIAQENDSGVHYGRITRAADVSHYLDWKKKGWLAPYLPEGVVKHFPADQIDPGALYATACAWFEVIGYNTKLVKPEDAPKSYADLLDPKWQGKIVKAHPSYSGAILTATFVLSRDLGWSYLEKLAAKDGAGPAVGHVGHGGDATVGEEVDAPLAVAEDRHPERDPLDRAREGADLDHVVDLVLVLKEDHEPVEVVADQILAPKATARPKTAAPPSSGAIGIPASWSIISRPPVTIATVAALWKTPTNVWRGPRALPCCRGTRCGRPGPRSAG